MNRRDCLKHLLLGGAMMAAPRFATAAVGQSNYRIRVIDARAGADLATPDRGAILIDPALNSYRAFRRLRRAVAGPVEIVGLTSHADLLLWRGYLHEAAWGLPRRVAFVRDPDLIAWHFDPTQAELSV